MDTNALLLFAVTGAAVLIAVGLGIHLAGRARRAVEEFALRRGLTCLPADEGGVLAERLLRELGLPGRGELRQIVPLHWPGVEAYFFTKLPSGRGRTSSTSRAYHTGSRHHFIAVFQQVPTTGRSFIAPRLPLSGIGLTVAEFVLREVFGADRIELLDLEATNSKLAERFNIFTEDALGARRLLLYEAVATRLLQAPSTSAGPLIAVAPGGFGIEIEPTLKNRERVELYLSFAEALSRALVRAAEERQRSSMPPPAVRENSQPQ